MLLNEKEEQMLVERAVGGDREAMERLLADVQDLVFNLSLRMLGTVQDAEDASQEIAIRIITRLATFRGESRFRTWVYRISVRTLLNYKKSRFYRYPLDFESYSADIRADTLEDPDDMIDGVESKILADELKMSCTNVMLQCLDVQSRCIWILGSMFRLDSATAADILDMTPENYRQKLSRLRAKMNGFLSRYCGLSGTGLCSCKQRVNHAIRQGRISPKRLEYGALEMLDRRTLEEGKREMEELEDASGIFTGLPAYRSPQDMKALMQRLLDSPLMKTIEEEKEVVG